MQKTLHFKTHSLLKNLVGKDLINDDKIAIIELVKNAYDASSEGVIVRFDRISGETNSEQILIGDRGTGMNESDIVDKWLNIAYSEKKNRNSEHGAYYAGNKGIGRFSCDRLGTRLDLFTRKDSSGPIYHLYIDWEKFEDEGDKDKIIQKVGVLLKEVSSDKMKSMCGQAFAKTGTVLLISNLRSEWDRDKLLSLKQSMERFINPNQIFSTKKFEINLSVPSEARSDASFEYHQQVNGTIKNRIFENLEFKTTYISSTINETGDEITTSLFHEGEAVFKLLEKNSRYLELKNVNIFVYYLNAYKKAFFKRQTGIRSIDFGSIFLFLNGFRIAPYGERGDDWLAIDSRKTQGVNRYLGNRDVVGRIEIIDNEDNFKPISSREGLKKTPAFNELKEEYFLDVFRKLERFVVEGLGWDSIPDHLKSTIKQDDGMDWKNTNEEYVESWDRKRQRIAFEIVSYMGGAKEDIISFWFNPSLLDGLHEKKGEEVRSLIKSIEDYSAGTIDIDLAKNLGSIKDLIDSANLNTRVARKEAAELRVKVERRDKEIAILQKEKAVFIGQNLFLKSISTLDEKNLLGFHHQILLDADILKNYGNKALRIAKKEGASKALLQNIQDIMLANMRIIAVAQFATKANFKSSTTKELTDIPSFFEQYILNIASGYVATGLNVTVENEIEEMFQMKVNRIEMSIVIDNIIRNAVKAHARKLHVAITGEGNDLEISFKDDGSGLDSSIADVASIFEIGFTTTNGSGIGLYHSKQIIEKVGGRVHAADYGKKGFEIRLELTK